MVLRSVVVRLSGEVLVEREDSAVVCLWAGSLDVVSVRVVSVRVDRPGSVAVEELVVVVPLVVVEPAVGEEGVEACVPSLAHPPIIIESTKVPGISKWVSCSTSAPIGLQVGLRDNRFLTDVTVRFVVSRRVKRAA